MGTRPRPARTVLESGFAFELIAAPPLVRALTRDLRMLRRLCDRPTRLDQADHPTPTFRRHRSVTVHESLPGVCVAVRQLHTRPGGSTLSGCHQRPEAQQLEPDRRVAAMTTETRRRTLSARTLGALAVV